MGWQGGEGVSIISVPEGGFFVSYGYKRRDTSILTISSGVVRDATMEEIMSQQPAPAPIVVTRHPALVQYMVEQGLVKKTVDVLTHVDSPEQIRGRHVFGVLPLSLAALTASVTEIPLDLKIEDRGKELSIERLREIAGTPATYTVAVNN